VVCPDKSYDRACKSFEELVRAGDKAVTPTASTGGVALVCFRQPEDEFFILDLGGPGTWSSRHFDSIKKAIVPDVDAVSRALGSMWSFANGVEDQSRMPIRTIDGVWEFPGLDLTFDAKKVNSKDVDEHSGVLVSESQIEASVRFQNRLQKNIDYRLVIQRSTGRFTETYTDESGKLPFQEGQGRCARLPLKKPEEP